MSIDYTARHFHLDDEVRDFTASKLNKTIKFLDDPVEVHVVLEYQRRLKYAELNVTHKHGSLHATEEAEDLREAISAAVAKLEKQARRSRKKMIGQRRRAQHQDGGPRHWPVEVIDSDSLSVAKEERRVIKTTRLPIKPMTLEEAAQALASSKNDFFLYLDSSSDQVHVLYRRRDDNFGLIAPES